MQVAMSPAPMVTPQHIIDNSGILRSKNLSDFVSDSAGSLPSNREKLPLAKDVPVIDMLQLESVVAMELATACREWGFFQLLNHGVPLELLDRLRACAHALFALPFEQKKKAAVSASTNFYGYGVAQGRTYYPNAWMEAFSVESTPVNHFREHLARLGVSDSEFEESICGVVEEYVRKVDKLTLQLTELLAQGLGIDAKTFSRHLEESKSSFFRMNYYPPCPQPSVTQGIGPHVDFNILTILLQDTVPGLQILQGSDWVTVEPRPDALVVNVGDGLQAWCNNKVRSILHRSLVNSSEPRLSVGFFLKAGPDTIISAPPELEDNTEKQPLRHYRDFMFKDMEEQYFRNRGKKEFITPLQPYIII